MLTLFSSDIKLIINLQYPYIFLQCKRFWTFFNLRNVYDHHPTFNFRDKFVKILPLEFFHRENPTLL